jgi:drug/metabolite transporter (DMT)-like permease
MRGHRLGFTLVTASAVAWSTGGLFTRVIAEDSWTMLAWRGILGALGLAVVLTLMPQPGRWRALRNLGPLGWFFVLQSSAGMIFFLTALRATTVAHVAVIYATVPFIAAALGWLVTREKPAAGAVTSSLIALVGVAVMVGLGRDGSVGGDLLAFGMTITMAVAMVIARHFPGLPFLQASCMSALLSGLISLPFGRPMSVSGHDVWLLTLFGLTTFAVGLPLFTLGARRLPPIETALIGSLEAPLAPLWVWLAFKETPGAATMIGGSIVFAAVGIHLVLGYGGIQRPATASNEPL